MIIMTETILPENNLLAERKPESEEEKLPEGKEPEKAKPEDVISYTKGSAEQEVSERYFNGRSYDSLSDEEKKRFDKIMSAHLWGREEKSKSFLDVNKPQDMRPPKKWWERATSTLARTPGVRTPERLAGWLFYHHMKPKGTKEPREFDFIPFGKADDGLLAQARRRKRTWLRANKDFDSWTDAEMEEAVKDAMEEPEFNKFKNIENVNNNSENMAEENKIEAVKQEDESSQIISLLKEILNRLPARPVIPETPVEEAVLGKETPKQEEPKIDVAKLKADIAEEVKKSLNIISTPRPESSPVASETPKDVLKGTVAGDLRDLITGWETGKFQNVEEVNREVMKITATHYPEYKRAVARGVGL